MNTLATPLGGKISYFLQEISPSSPHRFLNQGHAIHGMERFIQLNGKFISGAFEKSFGVQKSNNEPVVVRLIRNEALMNSSEIKAFRKLYDIELKYYQNVSEIIPVREGWIYTRKHFSGTSLDEYINSSNLRLKTNISELGSTDLKLFLRLFEEASLFPNILPKEAKSVLVNFQKPFFGIGGSVSVVYTSLIEGEDTEMEAIDYLHNLMCKLLDYRLYDQIRNRYGI